jgi:DNA-binding HxlR family transcriptional regulator
MSPSVLYARLNELTDAGLVAQDADLRYALTDIGRTLGSALEPLDEWSRRWARQLEARLTRSGTPGVEQPSRLAH